MFAFYGNVGTAQLVTDPKTTLAYAAEITFTFWAKQFIYPINQITSW